MSDVDVRGMADCQDEAMLDLHADTNDLDSEELAMQQEASPPAQEEKTPPSARPTRRSSGRRAGPKGASRGSGSAQKTPSSSASRGRASTRKSTSSVKKTRSKTLASDTAVKVPEEDKQSAPSPPAQEEQAAVTKEEVSSGKVTESALGDGGGHQQTVKDSPPVVAMEPASVSAAPGKDGGSQKDEPESKEERLRRLQEMRARVKREREEREKEFRRLQEEEEALLEEERKALLDGEDGSAAATETADGSAEKHESPAASPANRKRRSNEDRATNEKSGSNGVAKATDRPSPASGKSSPPAATEGSEAIRPPPKKSRRSAKVSPSAATKRDAPVSEPIECDAQHSSGSAAAGKGCALAAAQDNSVAPKEPPDVESDTAKRNDRREAEASAVSEQDAGNKDEMMGGEDVAECQGPGDSIDDNAGDNGDMCAEDDDERGELELMADGGISEDEGEGWRSASEFSVEDDTDGEDHSEGDQDVGDNGMDEQGAKAAAGEDGDGDETAAAADGAKKKDEVSRPSPPSSQRQKVQSAAESEKRAPKEKREEARRPAVGQKGSKGERSPRKDRHKVRPVRSTEADRHRVSKYLFYGAQYFMIKSNNHENVALAKAKGVWSTPPQNEARLNKAFQESTNVILIFSVKESGAFQGFARLASASDHKGPKVNWVLPRYISQKALSGVFKLDWVSRKEVPFPTTIAIRNPWNENKPVKVSRDGQELKPSCGEKLCQLFELDGSCDYERLISKIKKAPRPRSGRTSRRVPRGNPGGQGPSRPHGPRGGNRDYRSPRGGGPGFDRSRGSGPYGPSPSGPPRLGGGGRYDPLRDAHNARFDRRYPGGPGSGAPGGNGPWTPMPSYHHQQQQQPYYPQHAPGVNSYGGNHGNSGNLLTASYEDYVRSHHPNQYFKDHGRSTDLSQTMPPYHRSNAASRGSDRKSDKYEREVEAFLKQNKSSSSSSRRDSRPSASSRGHQGHGERRNRDRSRSRGRDKDVKGDRSARDRHRDRDRQRPRH